MPLTSLTARLSVLKTDADASVVDAVMAIGRSHGLEVIAEGIETADHLEFVRQRGCNRAQGFLIAPPIAADEAERMLLDRVPSL